MLETFHGHVIEEAGIEDLGAEALLLKQVESSEGWPRVAAAHDQSCTLLKINARGARTAGTWSILAL